MIGLLDRPSAGEVVIDGMQVARLSDSHRAEIRKNKIGFIFQSYNLITDLTALENVMLPLMMAGNSSNHHLKNKASLLLKKVGLEQQIDKMANQLSGGQMQRVAIARALVNRPALVLGDEPTGNLDSHTSGDVISLMKKLNRDLGQTFAIVTHAKENFGNVDRIITLKDGLIERNEIFDGDGRSMQA
jgi:lipoprotein-releasing system ATP-binding protein